MPWDSDGWKEPELQEGPTRRHYSGREYPSFRFRSGPPLASRTQPIHCPHYSDERFSRGKEHTLYGATAKGLNYEYSDRLWQWDYDKAQESGKAATAAGHSNGSPAWYEAYLTAYHGKPVTLLHIIGGVNQGNGYEYYVFGFSITEGDA